MSYQNQAMWLKATDSQLCYVIDMAPYISPNEYEIVIKNQAIAVNPFDVLKAQYGSLMMTWIKYPFIMGTDVAGTVIEVGSKVKKFVVGQRVCGFACGICRSHNKAAEGGFQLYTVLCESRATQIPEFMSYEEACVIPMGISTAAVALFQPEHLALELPQIRKRPTNKIVLIWGGSSSVGCNAIQLAKAAGYTVVTTCSPRNFSYIKGLGADFVLDYHKESIVSDILAIIEPYALVGAVSIGEDSSKRCLEVLGKSNAKKPRLAMVSYPIPLKAPKFMPIITVALDYIRWKLCHFVASTSRRIQTRFVDAFSLNDLVSTAIYNEFLPQALTQGMIVPSPNLRIAGQGLDHIIDALDILRKGVSATKVVVKL